ncbi:hypothetical protein SDC9_136739 [bioreactor metagenome]|uniref:Uncharacterized protein n=1 Tax=bioreactor metagenome TaxID=1076179 RepID=A0A645DK28_9ZZZZ
MRTADKTLFRLRIRILPNYRIALFDAFQLRIVNNIGFCISIDNLLTHLHRIGRHIFNMIQSNRTVGCGCGTHILQIRFCFIIEFCTDKLIKSFDVWYILHHFQTDCTAKNLCFRFFGGFDFNNPFSLSALVCQ